MCGVNKKNEIKGKTKKEKIEAAGKRISIDEKRSIQKKASDELLRLDTLLNSRERVKIDNIKDKFAVCELVYKLVLTEYLKHKKKTYTDLKIQMSQVPYAFAFAGYNFDNDLLNKIFGSNTEIGKRSVKKMRDSLNHSLDDKTIKELDERYDDLISTMDGFLDVIRNNGHK